MAPEVPFSPALTPMAEPAEGPYARRAHDGGSLGPTIAIVCGYALNATGVVLMVRYGLPYSLPLLGLIRKALTEKESDEDDKRHMMGAVGLILLVFGTALQIISVILK